MNTDTVSPVLQLLSLFAPMLLLGGMSFLALVRFWAPIAEKLGASSLDRTVSRRVIFAGVVGGSAELNDAVRKCRLVFASIYASFLVLALVYLGVEGFLFLGFFMVISVFFSRPYEIEEVEK